MCEFFKHAEKYTASIDLTFLNHEAYEAQVQVNNKMDFYLDTNTNKKKKKNIDVVQKLFEAATPWKQNLRLKRTHTNIGAALKRVLQPHVERLDQAIDTFHYGGIPPLDVVVVTDGVPGKCSFVVTLRLSWYLLIADQMITPGQYCWRLSRNYRG